METVLKKEKLHNIAYFKRMALEHLAKLEKQESGLRKAGYPVGTIRHWKGKDYIKVAPNKWRPKYGSHNRGAKMAISAIKRKINAAQDEHAVMQILLENRDRFSDKDGHPLPFVQELSEWVKSNPRGSPATGTANAHTAPENPKTPQRRTYSQSPLKDWIDAKGEGAYEAWNGKIYENKQGKRIYIQNKEHYIPKDVLVAHEKWKKLRDEIKAENEAIDAAERPRKTLIDEYVSNIKDILQRKKELPSESWLRENIKLDHVKKDMESLAQTLGNTITKDEAGGIISNLAQPDLAEIHNRVVSAAREIEQKRIKEKQAEIEQAKREEKFKSLDNLKTSALEELFPDLTGAGHWNGILYGGRNGYSVYVDGKKKSLSVSQTKAINDWIDSHK